MPEWLAARTARRNLQLIQSVDSRACCDVDYPLLLAANATLLGRRDEAVQHLDEALRLDNRPEVYFNRGSALLALGRIDEAVRDFAIAVDFDSGLLTEIDGNLRDRVAKVVVDKAAERERARTSRRPHGEKAAAPTENN
ncbi:MAG TPA: hypothetical protein VLV78_15730 [Thermoanaerobaculia bacterium]|nr:hypothetical protein [Thermoanaerobaculia bacterium]